MYFPSTTTATALLLLLAGPTTASLSSILSSSPIFALQTGFAQFAGLLSPLTFSTVAARLAILPARSASLTGPLQKAFLATQLALTQADQATLIDAQACLTEILARGSIPQGYACVDSHKNTVSRYSTAANTVIEQFVGIVPPSTLTVIQDQLTAYFNSLSLIPPVSDLLTSVQNVLSSVAASTSGETVTAVERLEGCLTAAIGGGTSGGLQTSYKCFTDPSGSLGNLENIFHGVVQQFVGYLPPNVIQDVINIYTYYLSAPNAVPGYALLKAIDPSILSMTASTSGNGVTAIQQLVQCVNDLIMSPSDAARSSYVCVLGHSGPLMTTQVLINGIVQQTFGYLPPTLVLALEQQLRPLLSSSSTPTSSALTTAFSTAFRLSSAGPETTTCFLALQDCVNSALLVRSEAVCQVEKKCATLGEVGRKSRGWFFA